MNHFRATNQDTGEVVEYDADLPDLTTYPAPLWATQQVFIAPPTPDQPPDPVDPIAWRITPGAFFDRFGALKWAVLASTDPMVQAMVRDAMVRPYLELYLRKAEIGQGLAYIASLGFAIDQNAILNTQPTDAERPGA